MSRYAFEIVNPAGELVADFTGRAFARRLTLSRNEAEDIFFVMDLNEFERYCDLLDLEPQNVLAVYQNEVRVKRGLNYICGGQLSYIESRINQDRQVIEVRATGFLNLFKDRYTDVERIFTAEEATTIASTLIDESQALDNGDFGVTMGVMATVGDHDRTYRRTNIKDALQALTRVQTNAFDFEFTYDKVFNTYESIGSNRPDIIFEFPGNIKSIGVPLDATGVANQIIVLGSGFGEEAAIQVTVDDEASQLNYKLRQKIITPNSVQEADTLTDHGNAELSAWSVPFELPSIEVDGNLVPYVGDYGIGDRVRVRIENYKMLEHIDAVYRIEKIDISVDDNDNENVKLYLSR